MSFYDEKILPHLINAACGSRPISRQREKIVPLAEGRVLEVGMGSGLNIPYYDPQKIDMVWGLEPSLGMRNKAQKNLREAEFEIEWLDLPGEEIPLDDKSADTVLLTYTLCSIADWRGALAGMRRVLKPGGRLLFSEHGQAPDISVRKWQDRINPLWNRVSGGCHINRAIPALLEEAGFSIDEIDSRYLPGLKIASYHYWGSARGE
jgi:SAM-dependent methyltransferase